MIIYVCVCICDNVASSRSAKCKNVIAATHHPQKGHPKPEQKKNCSMSISQHQIIMQVQGRYCPNQPHPPQPRLKETYNRMMTDSIGRSDKKHHSL